MTPLVSCICVTRGAFAHHALAEFSTQDYENRELVVVFNANTIPSAQLAELAAHPQVTLVCAPSDMTLGALRNVGIGLARGEWVIQWDDDDVYHPSRISRTLQHAEETGSDAVCLERWHIFHEARRRMYLSSRRAWEGSILVKRSVAVQVGYPDLVRGEDSAFITKLEQSYSLSLLDAPELYVYRIHGSNSWDETHFDVLCAQADPLDATSTLKALFHLMPSWKPTVLLLRLLAIATSHTVR